MGLITKTSYDFSQVYLN